MQGVDKSLVLESCCCSTDYVKFCLCSVQRELTGTVVLHEFHSLTLGFLCQVPMPKKSAGMDIEERKDEKGSKSKAWIKMHAEVRKQMGIENTASWTAKQSPSMLEGLHQRQRALEVVDMAVAVTALQHPHESPDEINARLFVDVSQSASRKPWSSDAVLRTLTGSSRIFSPRYGRVLLPHEHLAVLGFPRVIEATESLTASEVRDLAGDAMSVPSITMIVIALMTSIPGHWQHL